MNTSYHVPERLHADRRQPVRVQTDTLDWTPSPLAGVERRFLERDGAEVARATSLVRYAPGSSFSAHTHELGEEYLVLDGTFSDAHGDFPAGSYVRNPPGSRHAPFTLAGCTIFVKLRQMALTESRTLELRPLDIVLRPTPVTGLSRAVLFEADMERVYIERLDPSTSWRDRRVPGGEEILVLEGTVEVGDVVCPPLTWLRIPAQHIAPLVTSTGARWWVKRGHLPG